MRQWPACRALQGQCRLPLHVSSWSHLKHALDTRSRTEAACHTSGGWSWPPWSQCLLRNLNREKTHAHSCLFIMPPFPVSRYPSWFSRHNCQTKKSKNRQNPENNKNMIWRRFLLRELTMVAAVSIFVLPLLFYIFHTLDTIVAKLYIAKDNWKAPKKWVRGIVRRQGSKKPDWAQKEVERLVQI